MEMKVYLRALCVLGAFTHVPVALAVVDANAPVVKLRDPANGGCTEAGAPLHNCFTTSSNLENWIWNTRNPTAEAPLLVEIGPGVFGGISCAGSIRGYTTFRGAGRGRTVLTSSDETVITVMGCTKLTFESLSVIGQTAWAIEWNGTGESVWTNVEVEAPSLAWYDSLGSLPCSAGQAGKHYWFSSTIRISRTASTYPGVGVPVYYSTCGDSWFWGSEIANLNINTTSDNAGIRRGILAIGSGASVHVYGSNIRVVSDEPTSVSEMIGVQVAGGASVHIHGTGIDVEAAGAVPIVALKVGSVLRYASGGLIHADGAAYNLRTGSGGSITRVSGEGHDVHAPYLWSGHMTPPDIISQDGADTAVVTSETGGTPRLVIYSTACDSKWFDVGSNDCRP